MKIKFWLLDIAYTIEKGKPQVELWGIDERGNRILIIDKIFRPYFYAIPRKDANIDTLIQQIKKLSTSKSPILKIEKVERKFFGKPLAALRLMCQNPKDVPGYRDAVIKIRDIDSYLEADIRYSIRYLIDNQLIPCGWHLVDVEEIPNDKKYQVDKIYIAKKPPVPTGETFFPELRIMSFDIECYNPKGVPIPDRDPIIIISVITSSGIKKQFLAEDHGDVNLIKEFVNFIKEFDPDIIVGYNSNRFDWPYLMERAARLGVKLDIGRNRGEPHTSVYGHISIAGRANMDLLDYAEELYEVKVKTLENVAEYLGVMKTEERTIINKLKIAEYWDHEDKRKELLKYAMEDAESTFGIAEEALPFAMQLSSIVGLPLDQVLAAAVGFRVEWHLMRHAYLDGELAPNRVERKHIPYKGGLVLKPKMGIHENVIVYDFSALYPNLMIRYNISPDTYVPPDEDVPPEEVYVAPEVNHRFLKSPPGLYKRALTKLLKAREEIRQKMKQLDPRSLEYKLLDNRQRAIKVIANATYGYAGWIGARWYIKPVAEATTAWGRETIKKTIEIAKKLGLTVIYGDTDSVFLKYEPDKIEKFEKMVEKELGLDIKPDKIYKRVFFTEAKKRYAGLLKDGRIDAVGLEVVRGDWSEIAREVQEKVIEIVIREKSPEKAANYVRDVIKQLKEKKVPYEQLVIWKTLTRKLEEYKVEAAHVMAAKKLLEAGGTLEVGDKIGYVIVKGEGKLADKAVPHNMADYDDIDIEYYINKQIIPAALRILEGFGYDEKQLKTGERQVSLFDFLKK